MSCHIPKLYFDHLVNYCIPILALIEYHKVDSERLKSWVHSVKSWERTHPYKNWGDWWQWKKDLFATFLFFSYAAVSPSLCCAVFPTITLMGKFWAISWMLLAVAGTSGNWCKWEFLCLGEERERERDGGPIAPWCIPHHSSKTDHESPAHSAWSTNWIGQSNHWIQTQKKSSIVLWWMQALQRHLCTHWHTNNMSVLRLLYITSNC